MGDFAPEVKRILSGARLLLRAAREGRPRNVEKPDQRQKLSRRSQNYVPTHSQRYHEASWFAEGIQVASVASSDAKAARLWQPMDSRGFDPMTGHRPFDVLAKGFSAERKARVAARVSQLKADMPLHELRQARERSQEEGGPLEITARVPKEA
jgi:hypothetical protein